MEASTRLFCPTSLSRHFLPKRSLKLSSIAPLRNPNPRNPFDPPFLTLKSSSLPQSLTRSVHFLSSSLPSSNPHKPLLSLSSSQTFPSNLPQERLDRLDLSSSDPNDELSLFDRGKDVADDGDLGFCAEKGAIWTVVLLGWLGSEERHLKRYAEIYNSKGIRSVRFVVPVRETLGIDLGRRVEKRIAGLAKELVAWCSESKKDGRERHLIFHTFSNTGWLTYGVLLQNFQSRCDIIEKIKGCVVDSGACAEMSAQLMAAGYCAALLNKRSSLTYSSVEFIEDDKLDGRSNGWNAQDQRPAWIEIIALKSLEIFFSIILMLPYVNQRFSSIISTLKDQPPCPQLYLYSSADKIMPVRLVERFIQEQKALGRNVLAHNFGSSPHVDHFRSFPHTYSAKVNEFLKHCCSTMVCKT